MRCLLALAFLVAPITALHASEADLAGHLQRVRDAEPNELAGVLNEAAKVVRGLRHVPKEGRETCRGLLAEAKTATQTENGVAKSAGWQLATSVLAALKTPAPQDAAWFLGDVAEAWKARANNETARAAIVAAMGALYDENAESTKQGKAAERAVKKALSSKGEPALFVSLALGLARATTKRARKLLSRSLPRKGLQDDGLVAVLKALGEAGGSSAVPILLDHVPDTPAVVLEEALVALFSLEPEVLRKQWKKILAVTIEANAETHEARALGFRLEFKSKLTPKRKARKKLLDARWNAWTTDRMVDTPPMKVPAGIGVRGVQALWWKIVDALKGLIRPPEAKKNARPQFMNGRPNLVDWRHWLRGAR